MGSTPIDGSQYAQIGSTMGVYMGVGGGYGVLLSSEEADAFALNILGIDADELDTPEDISRAYDLQYVSIGSEYADDYCYLFGHVHGYVYWGGDARVLAVDDPPALIDHRINKLATDTHTKPGIYFGMNIS